MKDGKKKMRIEMRPIVQKQAPVLAERKKVSDQNQIITKSKGELQRRNGQEGNFSKKGIDQKKEMEASVSEIEKLKRKAKEQRHAKPKPSLVAQVSGEKAHNPAKIHGRQCFVKKPEEGHEKGGIKATESGRAKESRVSAHAQITKRKRKLRKFC